MVQIITGAEMAETAKAARKRKPGRPPKAAAGMADAAEEMGNEFSFSTVSPVIDCLRIDLWIPVSAIHQRAAVVVVSTPTVWH